MDEHKHRFVYTIKIRTINLNQRARNGECRGNGISHQLKHQLNILARNWYIAIPPKFYRLPWTDASSLGPRRAAASRSPPKTTESARRYYQKG